MNRKVLVTGATGFVGQQVVCALSDCGMELRLIVREGKEEQIGYRSNVTEIITTKDLFSENVEWWKNQCDSVDTVVHLAWYAVPGQYLESLRNLDCLVGSLNLARGAAQAGVRRFVGVGTCFEYDLTTGVLSVDTPVKPITPYADAKAALYFSLSHWFSKADVEFAWCRLFYLYGEVEDPRRLVPYLRSKLEAGEPAELTNGRQIRDFLDVAKAGQMIAKVTLGSQIGPINICSGIPITVRQLAEQIADEYGRRDLLQFGARPDNLVDPLCVLGIPNMKLQGEATQ